MEWRIEALERMEDERLEAGLRQEAELRRPKVNIFLLFHLIRILLIKRLFVLVPIPSAALSFICLRTATTPYGVLIDILIPIGDIGISLRVLFGSAYLLSGRHRPLIVTLLVVLILRFFLL